MLMVISVSLEANEQWSVIHAGVLITPPAMTAREQVSVIVKGQRITEIRDGYVAAEEIDATQPQQVQLVELRDKYVLPGLIDCHVHLTAQVSEAFRLDAVTRSAAASALFGAYAAQRTLKAGFTTVRDMSAKPEAIMALRDAIKAGRIQGPHVIAAGAALSPTGGHGDPSNGFESHLVFPPEWSAVCNGADDCRAMVRQQVKLGADVIKVMATGGVLDGARAGLDQQFTHEELSAIVTTAHMLGRKVAAHAHGAAGIQAAVDAGVDSIEHGTFADIASLTAMKRRGVYLVPTLLAIKTAVERAEISHYFPDSMRDKARELGQDLGRQVRAARQLGVRIAFGTDSGVSEHGRNAEEFLLMVKAGVPPADAIRSATLDAATLLGIADEVGSIEPNKIADVIATARNPLQDVTELTRVVFVMHAGTAVEQPSEGHAMTLLTVPVEGGQLVGDRVGRGPPIVLLHSGAMDRRMWEEQMRPLSLEHEVIRFDLRGYGESSKATAPYSEVDDVRAVLDRVGVRKADLVGISLGGRIAIDFALSHPERVHSLVLVSTGPGGMPVSDAYRHSVMKILAAGQAGGPEAAAKAFVDLPDLATLAQHPGLRERVQQIVLANASNLLSASPATPLNPPALNRIAEIHCPTLIMVGDQDSSDVQHIGAVMKGSIANARELTIPSSGHLINMEQPELFNRAVLEFVDARSP